MAVFHDEFTTTRAESTGIDLVVHDKESSRCRSQPRESDIGCEHIGCAVVLQERMDFSFRGKGESQPNPTQIDFKRMVETRQVNSIKGVATPCIEALVPTVVQVRKDA